MISEDNELIYKDRCPAAESWEPILRFRCGQIEMISAREAEIFGGCQDFLQIVTVNAEIFVLAHENPRLQSLLQRTVNTVDGRILQCMCNLLYTKASIRLLNGSNFVADLASWCREKKEKLFLLGSSDDSNRRAVERLRTAHPGLIIDGFGPPLANSPFEGDGRAGIQERLESSRPEHLVVCFGGGKQELWIQENTNYLAALGVKRAYGLGGSIDFISGARRRAPRWMQLIGTEWFFRFLCEPRARFRRTLLMFKMPFYALQTNRRLEHLAAIRAQTNEHQVETTVNTE